MSVPHARLAAFSLLLSIVHSPLTQAALIDFETTPGGATPADDALVTPYVDGNLSISFGSDTDGDGTIDIAAHFEDRNNGVGPAPGDGGHPDDPVHGYTHGIGNQPFFYDHDATPGGEGGDWMIRNEKSEDFNGAGTEANQLLHPFLVVYSTPDPADLPTSASGQIWDIDSNAGGKENFPERYKVTAFNSNGLMLAMQQSPEGIPFDEAGTLSGRPWNFSFDNLGAGIARIEIVQTQTAGKPRGIAFDNFNATEPTTTIIPEPSALTLLTASAWMLMRRRRRTRPAA